MFRLAIAAFLMVGVLLTATSAQDEKGKEKDPYVKKETPPAKTKGVEAVPGDVEVFFLNGSKVRMIMQSEKLDVATAYGKLTVPMKDVRAIEFGLHFAEGVEAQIEAGIKGLGSADYREREKANKALIDLGPFSYPAVLEASRTKELEVSKRAKEIIQKLQAKHPKKDLKTSVEDKIITNHFTIMGRIQTSSVKVKTEYFGEQELTLAKMRNLRSMGGGSIDIDVQIDASKYGNAGQWMDTGYTVDGRSGISITAKGMIDVWPQQGGQFISGPQGFQATRNGGNQPLPAIRKIQGGVNVNVHCGMLLGKIGEDGELFIVADRYEATPEHEGKLFLHIGPSQWNVQCSGNFDVHVGRKND